MSDTSAGAGPMSDAPFGHCADCPSKPGCSAASFCVTESRFHYADRSTTAPVCQVCQRQAGGAWSCDKPADTPGCGAYSDLWAQWFLVMMYARDALDGRQPAEPDDDEPCYHEHDEECEDEQGYLSRCHHEHCFACGGCRCPGYCDDHQTYNLRPAETGGTG